MLAQSGSSTHSSLLQRARLKEPAAWREFVSLYGPLVAHWCRRCGLNDDRVADCVQDVFVSVATSLHQHLPTTETGAFRAWLWTIARRRVIDLLRRNSRHAMGRGGSTAVQALRDVQDPLSVPDEEPTGDLQLRELTRRALAQVQCEFEPSTWQAFWRSIVDGVSTALVARELNMSEASVRQARSRILRRLRQQLGDMA